MKVENLVLDQVGAANVSVGVIDANAMGFHLNEAYLFINTITDCFFF